jgi:hypothetical protein
MNSDQRYAGEAPAPAEASMGEALLYAFNETARRAYHSTDGLDAADFDLDPGAGAMSIGELQRHQAFLLRLMIETVEPGASGAVPKAAIGEPGAWDVEAFAVQREALNEQFRAVWSRCNYESLMEKRPGQPPDHWAEWPALMRLMRPMVDVATHVGQVNYARRQLGKPVAKN